MGVGCFGGALEGDDGRLDPILSRNEKFLLQGRQLHQFAVAGLPAPFLPSSTLGRARSPNKMPSVLISNAASPSL